MENEKIEQLNFQKEKLIELQDKKKATLKRAEEAVAAYQEKIDGIDKQIEAVHVEEVKEKMNASNMSWEDVISLFGGNVTHSNTSTEGEHRL